MSRWTDDQFADAFGATRAETDAVEALRDKHPDLNDPIWMDRVARLVVEKDIDRRWDPAFVEQVYLDEKRRLEDTPTRRRWWHRFSRDRVNA